MSGAQQNVYFIFSTTLTATRGLYLGRTLQNSVIKLAGLDGRPSNAGGKLIGTGPVDSNGGNSWTFVGCPRWRSISMRRSNGILLPGSETRGRPRPPRTDLAMANTMAAQTRTPNYWRAVA